MELEEAIRDVKWKFRHPFGKKNEALNIIVEAVEGLIKIRKDIDKDASVLKEIEEERRDGIMGMAAAVNWDKWRKQITFEHYVKVINICKNHLESGLCKTCKLWFDGDTPTSGIGNCFLRVLEYLSDDQLKAFIKKIEGE